MAEPTLNQMFGIDATQDATTITLHKANFAATGFIPAATNTAESILGAILLYSQPTLTAANQAINTDQSVIITDSNDNLVSRAAVLYRRKTKIVSFDKVDNGLAFDPNDY